MQKATTNASALAAMLIVLGCSGSESSDNNDHDAGRQQLPDGRIVDPGPEPEEPGDPGCGFDSAAFCDTFDTASPGGRSGDLDDAIWTIARMTSDTNPTQGIVNQFPAALARNCDGTTELVTPPDDYRFCSGQDQGSHLIQTFDDGGGFAFHSFGPRRPFDFADRMGTVRFDLGGIIRGGHGYWVELWIVDESVPGPYQEAPGVMSFPRNGLGLKLGEGEIGCGEGGNGLTSVFVMRDFELVTDIGSSDFEHECFHVSDDALNRYELRISKNHVELWTSEPGDHENLRRVANIEGIDLPFTRGFVHFQQTHYNAGKDGNTPYATFHWDNIGFDGPVYPMVRGYDVPDSGGAGRLENSVNLGYAPAANTGGGALGEPTTFRLSDVDITDARTAALDMNITSFGEGAIQYRVNDSAWQRFERSVVPFDSGSWLAVHLPVDVASLRSGENTLEIAQEEANHFLNISNISLSVEE